MEVKWALESLPTKALLNEAKCSRGEEAKEFLGKIHSGIWSLIILWLYIKKILNAFLIFSKILIHQISEQY